MVCDLDPHGDKPVPNRYDGTTTLGDRYWAMDEVNQEDGTMTLIVLGAHQLWYYQPWQYKTFEQVLTELSTSENYSELFLGKGRVIELDQINRLVLCEVDGTLTIHHQRGKFVLRTPHFSIYSEVFDALHQQIDPEQPVETSRASLRHIGRGPWVALALTVSLTLMLLMIVQFAGKGPINPRKMQAAPEAKLFIGAIFWVAREAGFYGSLLLGLAALSVCIWWIRTAARRRPELLVIDFT